MPTEVGHHVGLVLRGQDHQVTVRAHAEVADGSQDSWAWFQGSESESERVLRELAARNAALPGFRPEWRL